MISSTYSTNSSYFVNRSVNNLVWFVNKTGEGAASFKATLQVTSKYLNGYSIFTDRVFQAELTEKLNDTASLLGFYSSFKSIVYWINPFSKESLDVKKLSDILIDSLAERFSGQLSSTDSSAVLKKIVDKVIKRVMQRNQYHHPDQVKEALEQILGEVLKKKSVTFNDSDIKQILDSVVIRKKPRTVLEQLSKACFTVAGLGGSVVTLVKWHVIDLSALGKLTVQIGSQSRVFMFLVRVSVGTVLGTFATAGLVLVLGEGSYRLVIHCIKYSQFSNTVSKEEKEKAYQALKSSLIDVFSTTTDLISTAAPLLFVLNPPVVVTLAIVARTVGFICIFVK